MTPIQDPILIFAALAFIMLAAPIIAHRTRIPDLVILILAGAALGPNGLRMLERSSAIELFGTVGLL